MTGFAMTFDCADARGQARFWCLALDYRPASPPQGWATWEDWLREYDVPEEEWDDGATIEDPAGVLPRISFLRVPEPKTAKNRLHLDVRITGGRHVDSAERTRLIEDRVDLLTGAGATVQERVSHHEEIDHVVLLDPEGNEFCVV